MRAPRGAAIALVSASALIVAGCSTAHKQRAAAQPHAAGIVAATRSADPVTPAPTPTPTDASAPAAWPAGNSSSCSLYLYGHDARIGVTSTYGADPQKECSTLASSYSSDGFWTTQTVTTNDATPVVCAVSHGDLVAVVRDGGSQIVGQSVCSSFLQSGWTEDAQAEQQARQQDADAVQASAQASARAADASTAETDVAALQSDGQAFYNAKPLRDDAAKADKDLAQERADAAKGNGEDCYNVQVNVSYDATTNVGYDVTTDGQYDRDKEDQALQAHRADLQKVEADLSTLKAEGLPLPAGAQEAIAKVQQQTAEAVATANNAIDQMNADMRKAYAIANSAGTGDCAGNGPGAAPAGLAHIK